MLDVRNPAVKQQISLQLPKPFSHKEENCSTVNIMKIWITRHGQTNLNKAKLMQGLTDEPLNETGRMQAGRMREKIGDISFDAVYASPLCRAIETACIIGNTSRDQVITDPRIIEVDFGKYEGMPYLGMGARMTLYWMLPEIFPAPETVEPVSSMILRSSSFLKELETRDYENVLVVCHGGIIRALRGFLEDRKSGIRWRPKPINCEVLVYESAGGKHHPIADYKIG